ncbi:MAG: hypothetical protein WBV85_08615 [Solirubrobacteraceae bacterium]
MPVALALVAGFAVLALALVLTLSGSPTVLARANGVPANQPILEAKSGSACQAGEFLPAGTSAIRLTLVADAGPKVSVGVFSGGRSVASGVTGSGWTSGAVTVPLKPLRHHVFPATVCFKFAQSAETVQLGGASANAATAARNASGVTLPGRFTVEYLRSGPTSWWSLASTVAHHFGLGRAPSGTWIAWLVLLIMVASVTLASYLVLRELE